MATAAAGWASRPLFGGAISCDIPSAWKDVSDIRQVPDHQECWQEIDGSLLVVEILEKQEVGDAEASKFFFQDLAESNGSTDVTFTAIPLTLSSPPRESRICAGLGFQKIAMGRDVDIAGNRREQEIKWVRIDLVVFRLASVETDLLVTVSTPIANPNEPSSEGPNLSEGAQRIANSLRVQDWGLFG
uniref:Mog1p/PsbP-like protein n=1 Tax=Craspedostauros australis TaxID=1486917 RepID=A0A7R9ZKA5_9STRA|mmetsp:Transcript_14165/g.39046  ORF Transcript_14165/g.39046 Transcript_14165/m.39046 type:complete len:187 (+) Transcript_14165:158-718(+)|eukprot:CAMPEP_0198124928 /NCGR_PEP_ID=MMETSP1442-20131203/41314_1 /TAXON_ID= /ORGANISM="Craspedostauros australis, Strain CCMP3328" /LENGTH=186 /DNA_ID=CAMNT_0043784437 /DNA_START=111 /DNA_END=671 /DNA_ORIENTATION=+